MKKVLAVVFAVALMGSVLAVPPAPANAASSPGKPLVTVYEHINRGGKSYTYYAEGSYRTTKGTLGLANDTISSIEVHEPVWVLLSEHDGSGGGRAMVIPKGFYNLTNYAYNDLVSKIEIYYGVITYVEFFIDINEDWGKWPSMGIGAGQTAKSMPSGWNDKLSCVVVPYGRTVTLYQHIDYGGERLVLSTGIHNLTNYKMGNTTWNDQVSSYKVQ